MNRGQETVPFHLLLTIWFRNTWKFHYFFGDDLKVECPTGSGQMMNLWNTATELSRRLTHIFLRAPDGDRPVYGGIEKFQDDPYWRDCGLFYEYFHGDNSACIGASH